MIDITVALLSFALRWESAPARYWYLTPFAFVTWVADVVAAHTTWALVAGRPKKGEWTISHTLERLCNDHAHPDNLLFIAIALKINRIDPQKNHIKAVM